MPTVIEINDLESLAAYELHWRAQLAETPDATFFQSYEWFVARCRHAGETLKPRVMIVLRGSRPIGIVPLVVETRANSLGQVRVLGYPLDDWGAVYGPLGRNGTAALTAALTQVRRTPRDWDYCELRWVDRTADQGRTPGCFELARMPARAALDDHVAQIELSGGFEAYWASREARFSSNIRRCERRLSEQGPLRHVHYRPLGIAAGEADPRWDLYETCVSLAARSWQAQGSNGITLSHASVDPLLREVHEAAARRGALDLHLLYVGEQPVAFAYNYHYRSHVFGLRMGYDPTCTDGAGHVLLKRAIEACAKRGDQIYDLGSGSLACKRRWWTRFSPICRYTHFPTDALKAQAVRFTRWLRDWTQSSVEV